MHMTEDDDHAYMKILGNKTYMMPVSPYFYSSKYPSPCPHIVP